MFLDFLDTTEKDLSQKKDEEILALSVSNPSVFSIILDRYSDAFLRKAKTIVKNKEGSEDIVQETFTKIYLNAIKFELKEGASFKSWAYKILLNTSYTHYQKYKKNKSISFTSEMEEIIPDIKNKDFEKNGLSDEILSIFARIPENMSRMLRLYFIEERSQKEIAEMENVSVGAIKTRIHRAKKEFKDEALKLV